MLRINNPSLFVSWLNPSFAEVGPCCFIRQPEADLPRLTEKEASLALEEEEWFQNHIHIFEALAHDISATQVDGAEVLDPHSPDFIHAWEIAKSLVEIWATRLQVVSPAERYLVVASKLNEPVVRFMKRRGDAMFGRPDLVFDPLVLEGRAHYILVG